MASSNDDCFTTWLQEKLATMGLDDMVDYIESIMDDTDTELDERVQSVMEYLEDACEEEDVDFEAMSTELSTKWQAKDQQEQIKKQIEEKEEQQRLIAKNEELLQKAGDAVIRNKDNYKEESKEEKKKKQLLLEEYGFHANLVSADGNFTAAASPTTASTLQDVSKNVNAELVAAKDKVSREKAKKKHKEQVEHNKMLLEKEKQKKEKQKQKKQKKEKRRGCG